MDQTSSKTTKWLAIVLIAVVTLALAFMGFFFLTKGKKPPLEKVEEPAITKVAPEAWVTITKDSFMPATLSITKGTQVTWTNKDSSPHQVASDPHPTHTNLEGFFSEEPLASNDTFSFSFEKTGTFSYHDHLNPLKFKGTVIVQWITLIWQNTTGGFKLELDMVKKGHKVYHEFSFSRFIDDPLIGSAMIVLALVALFFSISQFNQVLSGY